MSDPQTLVESLVGIVLATPGAARMTIAASEKGGGYVHITCAAEDGVRFLAQHYGIDVRAHYYEGEHWLGAYRSWSTSNTVYWQLDITGPHRKLTQPALSEERLSDAVQAAHEALCGVPL